MVLLMEMKSIRGITKLCLFKISLYLFKRLLYISVKIQILSALSSSVHLATPILFPKCAILEVVWVALSIIIVFGDGCPDNTQRETLKPCNTRRIFSCLLVYGIAPKLSVVCISFSY